MPKQLQDRFSMSHEIRKILADHPDASNRKVFIILTRKYPARTWNQKSFSVAVSQGRRKLGLGPRREDPAGRLRQTRPTAPQLIADGKLHDYDLLRSARELLVAAGSLSAAQDAVQLVGELQLS